MGFLTAYSHSFVIFRSLGGPFCKVKKETKLSVLAAEKIYTNANGNQISCHKATTEKWKQNRMMYIYKK